MAVGSEHAAPLVRHCWKKKKDWVEYMRREMEKIRNTTFIFLLMGSEYNFTQIHKFLTELN